jgi:hypothetical protein
MKWSNAQIGCFRAIGSGVSCHVGKTLRFLTLTSSASMRGSIEDCFSVFVKRVKRLTPKGLLRMGYICDADLDFYFPNHGIGEVLAFDYLSVLTSEGVAGVLHILYFGDWLPQHWVSDVWKDISGVASIIDIRKVDVSDNDIWKVARYVVNQCKLFRYVAGQSKFIRHSYSSNWVYRGWCRDFDCLRRFCRDVRLGKFARYGVHHPYGDFWSEWYKWLLVRNRFTIELCIDDFIDGHLTRF